MGDPNLSLISAFCVFLILFIICRELVCWYWKINERTDYLKQVKKSSKITNELLSEIKELLLTNTTRSTPEE